jgi:hypothetical protein
VLAAGALLTLLGFANAVLVNGEMTRLENEGPRRFALAGGGLDRFVPSLLANFSRANQPASTVSAAVPGDPRRTPQYVEHKRALERWIAVIGLGLAALFVGLEGTIPQGSAAARSPIGSDLARLLVLLSLALAALSFFES